METTGKLTGVTMDFMTRKLNVTFQIDSQPIEDLNELQKLDSLDIVAKKHRKKRSLDANSYFHVLVGKIADVMKISKTRCKNILIGRYGQQEFLDEGEMLVINSNLSLSKALEQETLHLWPNGIVYENGMQFNRYLVFRGSHTYNTKEMSILIDGTISEAKELGIETLPPKKLEQLMRLWGERYEKTA
jgi:hypothetical protein